MAARFFTSSKMRAIGSKKTSLGFSGTIVASPPSIHGSPRGKDTAAAAADKRTDTAAGAKMVR